MSKLISIIVPCFNEQEVFAETYKRLTETFAQLDPLKYTYEIIFVNDGSKDDTARMIQEKVKSDNRIKGINFSRNFGHQIAITAGLDNCKGDAAVVIDADLQDPPHIILDMIKNGKKGMMSFLVKGLKGQVKVHLNC